VTQSGVLHNILIECDIHREQVTLLKMCLNENYNKVRIYKNLPNAYLIQSGHMAEQEMVYHQ
jgi:hypothetical protein